MKKKHLMMLMLLFIGAIASISLASCSDDDDPATQVYSYGWEDFQSSGSDFSGLNEMETISNAFKAAIGSSSPVTLNGSASECDSKIKAACEKVEASLKGNAYNFSGRFEVKNVQTNKVVYSLQITQGSNLI